MFISFFLLYHFFNVPCCTIRICFSCVSMYMLGSMKLGTNVLELQYVYVGKL